MCLLTNLVVEEKEKALVGGHYWDQRRDEGRHPWARTGSSDLGTGTWTNRLQGLVLPENREKHQACRA